jgi:hypothetical protein
MTKRHIKIKNGSRRQNQESWLYGAKNRLPFPPYSILVNLLPQNWIYPIISALSNSFSKFAPINLLKTGIVELNANGFLTIRRIS